MERPPDSRRWPWLHCHGFGKACPVTPSGIADSGVRSGTIVSHRRVEKARQIAPKKKIRPAYSILTWIGDPDGGMSTSTGGLPVRATRARIVCRPGGTETSHA